MRKQALWLAKEKQESRLRDHGVLHVFEEQQEEAGEQGSGN